MIYAGTRPTQPPKGPTMTTTTTALSPELEQLAVKLEDYRARIAAGDRAWVLLAMSADKLLRAAKLTDAADLVGECTSADEVEEALEAAVDAARSSLAGYRVMLVGPDGTVVDSVELTGYDLERPAAGIALAAELRDLARKAVGA